MYADLKSKLLVGDVDRRRRLQIQWTKAHDAWGQQHVDAAVDKFQYESLLFALVSLSCCPIT